MRHILEQTVCGAMFRIWEHQKRSVKRVWDDLGHSGHSNGGDWLP